MDDDDKQKVADEARLNRLRNGVEDDVTFLLRLLDDALKANQRLALMTLKMCAAIK